jgi:hypothetical protein
MESRSIYVAREQVLFRNEGQNVLSPLHFLTLWVNNCRTIADRSLRRQVVFEAFGLGRPGDRWRFARHVAEWIAYERLEHPDRVVRELGTIALGLTPRPAPALGARASDRLLSPVYPADRPP